jgi:hypothetical protein
MSDIQVDVDQDLKCPDCGKQFHIHRKVKFSPEILTVVYKIAPGRKMMVEDFCDSAKALAKSLKLIAKDMGEKVVVGIEDLSVKDGEVSISLNVLEIDHAD